MTLFKRAKDLGVWVEYVGGDAKALQRAANYRANPVKF